MAFRMYTNVSFLERRIETLYGQVCPAMHALDQVREVMNIENGFTRDDGTDYYTHCVDVANTVLSYGLRNEDVVCAALLHDIIEDVEGYNRTTLLQSYNSNVVRLVELLTKKHGVNYHEEANLLEYINQIKEDPEAAAIKTADRMHNMMTLNQKSFESRYRKAMETKIYYLPFFHDCRKMYPRYESLFYAAKAQIEPLIYNIEAFYHELEKKDELIKELQSKLFELEVKFAD